MPATKRERRSARRGQPVETPLLKVPFRQLRSPLPPVELLAPEQVEQIHQASMRILEDIGLDFLDDESCDILAQHGAKVDFKTRHAWLDRGLVMEMVAKAPASFTWRARNPAHNLHIGSNAITFAPPKLAQAQQAGYFYRYRCYYFRYGFSVYRRCYVRYYYY